MDILLLPDKFKGSLNAMEVMNAISRGVKKVLPDARCIPVLASDGGDGFLDAVAGYLPVERIRIPTTDPLGRLLQADYLLHPDRGEAYVELAQASGLVLLTEAERNALSTTTFGTGTLINDAIKRGARKVFLGLGGSATNDAGIGIANALGYRFTDSRGRELPPIGSSLNSIQAISSEAVPEAVRKTQFVAINDVNNPLYGKNGAAYVYAAQKGASMQDMNILDNGLRRVADIVAKNMGKDLGQLPGTGAAGGTSFGLKAFFDARFQSGIDFILQLAGIPAQLKESPPDYIITGEGKIDGQTLSGKLINGVVRLGQAHDIPVLAVCGICEVAPAELMAAGLHDILEIRDRGQSLEYNMTHAAALLEASVARYFRSID